MKSACLFRAGIHGGHWKRTHSVLNHTLFGIFLGRLDRFKHQLRTFCYIFIVLVSRPDRYRCQLTNSTSL